MFQSLHHACKNLLYHRALNSTYYCPVLLPLASLSASPCSPACMVSLSHLHIASYITQQHTATDAHVFIPHVFYMFMPQLMHVWFSIHIYVYFDDHL